MNEEKIRPGGSNFAWTVEAELTNAFITSTTTVPGMIDSNYFLVVTIQTNAMGKRINIKQPLDIFSIVNKSGLSRVHGDAIAPEKSREKNDESFQKIQSFQKPDESLKKLGDSFEKYDESWEEK